MLLRSCLLIARAGAQVNETAISYEQMHKRRQEKEENQISSSS